MRPLTLLTLLLCSAIQVSLSANQARLTGRVSDPDGRPVAGAAVSLIDPAAARHTTTDDDGRFAFDAVAEGTADVSASAPGLAGVARVTVRAGAIEEVDLRLRVAAVSETLIVSASQIDQPLSRTGDAVTVLSGAELESRQVESLGAALRSVPGFTIASNGGPGTLTSVFPRGGESDFTLVLVDGVRQNGFGGGLDFSQVPLADVERIEVVRNPQSALYGSDAIGGVVQIITRSGRSPYVAANVETGSRDTRRAAASTGGARSALRWNANAEYFQDEGYTGLAPASGQTVSNDDARMAHGAATLGWRRAGGTDAAVTFSYVDTDRGAPGAYGSDPARRFAGVDRVSRGTTVRRAVGARVVQPWFGAGSRIRQRVEFDAADFDLFFRSAFSRSESGTRRLHARTQTDLAVATAFGASVGLEWLDERGRSTFITAGPTQVPIDRRVIGVFAEGRWTGHPRLSITAGARAEHIRRDALAGNPSPFSPRPAFAADTIVSLNPKVSGSWLLTSRTPADGARAWTRLRASAGTGIRPPDAFEIAFTDNPALAPERSRTLDAGVTQALIGGALQFDATAFFNEYEDLIVSVGRLTAASPYRTDNISNARARGVEISGAWRTRLGLSMRAAYTFLETEILSVDGVAGTAPAPYRVGDALLRRPRHAATGDATFTRGRVTAFAELTARGATLDAEPAFGPSGGLYTNRGHGVVNAGGSVRLSRLVELYARVLNLGDARYEEVLGFPAPGRTAFAGVRLAAGR